MEKIVYLDVDGTILNHEGQLSKLNQKTILEIQKKGIGVVLATGRNFDEIQLVAKELKLKDYLNYAICENGAYITKTDRFEPEFIQTINQKEVHALYDYLDKLGIYLFISTYKTQAFSYSNLDQESFEFRQSEIQALPKFKIKKIDDTIDWDAISMIAFDCPKDLVETIENHFKKYFPDIEYVVSRSAHRVKPLFMISAKNVNKATAIKTLNQELNVSDDNTYFFGDGINDVAAIQTFKNSFVPKSAPDYVKQETTSLIDAASNDGVGKKLQELFL